eukprot:6995036-Karenia_brevis.AAC.1
MFETVGDDEQVVGIAQQGEPVLKYGKSDAPPLPLSNETADTSSDRKNKLQHRLDTTLTDTSTTSDRLTDPLSNEGLQNSKFEHSQQ